jgi:TonB family protein
MKSNDDRTRLRRRARAAGPRALAAILAASAVALGVARAQPGSRVTGSVVSTDGERVVGAQVRLLGAGDHAAISDDDGRFEFFFLGDSADRALVVRRIGFRPETLSVRVPQAAAKQIEVRLVRAVQLLATVVVEGDAPDARSISAQVHERQKRSANGYFLFREDIEKMQIIRSSEVLRRLPGVHVTAGGIGHADVRLRANACAPLFWMDGTPLVGAPFDIDELSPNTIEAIEVYSSAATVPVEFRGPIRAQGCGSIVIWTREGERRPRRARIGADSIARLVDAARVFLPQEVDSEARLLDMPQPQYPDSLFRTKAPGTVVAEFIVDANGKIVSESIGLVTSSHVLFGNAVRLALPEATFRAAVRRGHPVAQVMQIPFTFKPPPG